ncbi:flavin reductase [candidate division KSB3 bacterium]|uniref:Flavin reductase n=1 Tax=candidate division KSB3 bacterium TaxID=2044937 RepID=A0A2G6KCS5_9BACT|nr:MAG: flavin reductase [candidate division KSB3 bacterium]
MERHPVPIEQFQVRAHTRWATDWLLLTAGDFETGHFNTMTVGWGSFGTMWKKPFAQVVVRPTRYTYEFMNSYDTFTLCGFPAGYKKALTLLGSKSGREGDKIAEAGLTPIASSQVAAPGFNEANLIVECRKIYWDDMQPQQFLEAAIEDNYPQKDYHRIYFGEIIAISGAD